MIQTISFKRFKRFGEQTLPLLPHGVTLLAGGNNSGKSSVLHGLAVWEFCRTVIEAEKGPKALLPGSSAQGLGLGADEFSPINVPSLAHLWTNLAFHKTSGDDDGYTLRIKATWAQNGQAKELEFGLALANDRLFAKTTASNLGEGDRIPRIAYLPPFAGITDKEQRVPGAVRRRRIGEGLAGAVLRNLLLDLSIANAEKRRLLSAGKAKITRADLRNLRETDPWELLQQALRTQFGVELVVSPFAEEYHTNIRVTVSKGRVEGYRLTRHPGYKPRDLMVEGSGFLQWLSVFALAVDPDTDTLLLDEPDAHLHCSLQRHMLEALENLAAASGHQVLIATHSTEILRDSDPCRILELAVSRSPRFLSSGAQKVGLFAGLGSEYAPRIDALKVRKRLLLVEGDLDLRILKAFAATLGRAIPNAWVEWKSSGGHEERKQLFCALKEEMPELVALSLRDRDDEPAGTVGEGLIDKSHERGPVDFHCRKWQRREIENYLLWPPAIAAVLGTSEANLEAIFRDKWGIAVGETFPNVDAPEALAEVRGEDVLKDLKVDAVRVAEQIPAETIPRDVISLLDDLDTLGA
ncbi:MAG: AAA family ATPase [Armatimonadetes bacterium]|nr:AAA family ATPase [Armatimonadota bacterium]